MQDPDPSFRPIAGQPEEIAAGVRRIVAPNPSPMTFRGTNTYLVGTRGIAVIDPGPTLPNHLSAILAAVQPGQSITHIIVTHAHLDHSPLAAPLQAATGAPILAFGDALSGRSPAMEQLAASGLLAGGEGVDLAFRPDQWLADGARVEGDGWSLDVLHTPGHMGNHIALGLGDLLFSGDLVMGWATSLVSPPDGDLTDFMASCERLLTGAWAQYLPGHGAPVTDPAARTRWLLDHRRSREAEILAALTQGPATARTLAERIYTQVPAALLSAAERNVLAHLIDLTGKSRVSPVESLSATGAFHLI
ncbi:MBL fold metallo-hydrolase [Pseudoprimorskyibacter insulae]|uniref:Hydroxyacylglutathione hydrolase GloC n=1 Tax=Pseudoprimorskyibacter insulae TaxID=1695997 RepID=A0A2R8B0N9_9RHOB|nr:MBL fold metallo-hydrolase [Pseudoprimorskyibacter insulae]SPF81852.1 Hydroxyacylglutathione hydrolase GloC [Pseudoprimorskyibacter insulae]